MKITRHGGNLIRLTRFGMVNAYLVREPDGFTLIDTMVPGSAKHVIAAAEAEGEPIARILLTHAHSDHVGSADALVAALPQAELSISERDSRFLRGDTSLDPGEPESKLRGGYTEIESEPDRLLHPGDRVGSLEVFAAPGHTPGQIALLDGRDGCLIAADAYSTLGGTRTTAEVNWKFPLPGMATWDRPLTAATAAALRDLGPERLAVGHGPVIENPVPAMGRALDRVG